MNNVELSRILNSILDEDFENTVIKICKKSEIDVEARDIEGCHQLPVSTNSGSHDKRVIVKFVNRKKVEALLKKNKKQINGKSLWQLLVSNKVFVSVPFYTYLLVCYFCLFNLFNVGVIIYKV